MSRARQAVVGCGAMLGIAALALGGVVGWAALTWRSKLAFPATPYPGLAAATDPGAVERGGYLVRGPAHCAQCHSTTDRDHPEQAASEPLHGGLAFDMGPIGVIYARNLTPDPTTGIGRRTDDELARVLRTGVLPDGQLSIFMRYGAARLSDDDVRDVIAYLRAQEPVAREVPDPQLTVLGKAVVKLMFPAVTPRTDAAPAGVPAGPEPTVERGRYLAEDVMLCTGCHTGNDPATFEPVGPKGGGGGCEPSHGADSDMEYCPPNLTSAPQGVTGRLDEDAFVARLKAGRAYPTSVMPWEGVKATSEADLRSVYRYLLTLPPVAVDTGPSYRPVGSAPG